MGELTGGTVTFLFTDIEGSTRLLRAAGDGYPAILLRQRELIVGAAESHGGHAFGTEGDAVFLAFHDAPSALAAAVDAQRALDAEPWPVEDPVRVRMGIHTGEATTLGSDDYVGLALHETARIAAAAHGGQVLVSAATTGLATAALRSGLGLRDLGDHRLKDFAEPQRLAQLTGPGLPDRFPALRSLEGRPSNLPVQLTSFVGREQLAEASALLGRSRLLTLTGPGGTGKTRLALQVADRALEDHADGAWFVPLETVTDPDQVPAEILAALSVATTGRTAPLDRLLEHLRPRRLLLVLDNLEQIPDLGPLVARLLREAPGVRVLATSRIPLHVSGEQELPVPPLSVPETDDVAAMAASEAVRLFTERAMAVRPGFALDPVSVPVVGRIVRRLDGLPLAIELAAARIRTLSPEAIDARLDGVLGLLTGGARDLPARQQTLRGAIGWSHDLLDDPERRLFRRLGAFAGSADLAGVVAVCGDATELGIDPLDGLDSLVDKSLVRAIPGREPRFTMLVTIRAYARECLDASGEADRIDDRHLVAFLAFAEEAAGHLTGPDGRAWLDHVEQEHDNLRAALDHAITAEEPERAMRLATALWRFWQIRGLLHEADRWFERVLAMPGAQHVPARIRAEALGAAGSVAYWRDDHPAMHRRWRAAVAEAERSGDPQTLADALFNLGFAPMPERPANVSMFAQGLDQFLAALAIYREIDDRRGLGRAAWAVGLGELYRGEVTEARIHAEEALSLAREAGDRFYEAWTLWNLGLLDLIAGDPDAATPRLRSALEAFDAMGDRTGPVLVLMGIALVARARGDEAMHWRLRGAVERLRQRTGADLVRQIIPFLDWRYDEAPSDGAARTAWEDGLTTDAGDAITLGYRVTDLL
jgi:predicted ATPase/class 3 adenylate cyclase